MPGSHLICSDLSFTYRAGPDPALDKLSFAVEQGEFVGLLGPNGSGKSTLLQCLSGLLPPGQGQILVAGKPITSLPERQRALLLAALPQRPETLPSLSAFALTLMGRYAHAPFLGAYSDHDKAVAFAALAECGAAHLAARPADCLSGGEAQRVLLARSLAQNAAVLLLDEPTAGLDPACARLVMEAIARRNQRKGLTVLAAMHDLNLAALYCDRLIFLKQGRLAADGPTRQVFTSAVLEEVYETRLAVAPHPVDGVPQALPL
ncbi:ABC transporter ATP-binding protein [Desulfovibrio sp. OttesenSCG-928-M14]|nr:ABC transporter ATP-binding protein [Desulfovibrio sp. OttesenSCG-928-M14]